MSEDALFILPLAMTLFLYILVANWIELLPLGFFPVLHGANADWNQTLAMGLIVIVTNYLNLLPGPDTENRYLLLGIALISGGFLMATNYR